MTGTELHSQLRRATLSRQYGEPANVLGAWTQSDNFVYVLERRSESGIRNHRLRPSQIGLISTLVSKPRNTQSLSVPYGPNNVAVEAGTTRLGAFSSYSGDPRSGNTYRAEHIVASGAAGASREERQAYRPDDNSRYRFAGELALSFMVPQTVAEPIFGTNSGDMELGDPFDLSYHTSAFLFMELNSEKEGEDVRVYEDGRNRLPDDLLTWTESMNWPTEDSRPRTKQLRGAAASLPKRPLPY